MCVVMNVGCLGRWRGREVHRGGCLVRLSERLSHLLYHLVPLVLLSALFGDLLRYGLRVRLCCSPGCNDIGLHLSGQRTMRRRALSILVAHTQPALAD